MAYWTLKDLNVQSWTVYGSSEVDAGEGSAEEVLRVLRTAVLALLRQTVGEDGDRVDGCTDSVCLRVERKGCSVKIELRLT